MNLTNEWVAYYPDLPGNRALPVAERICWMIQPPTVREVQKQDSDAKQETFFRVLLDQHVVAIKNMEIAGQAVTTVVRMEELAASYLSPRVNKILAEELLRAITESCFLAEVDEKK